MSCKFCDTTKEENAQLRDDLDIMTSKRDELRDWAQGFVHDIERLAGEARDDDTVFPRHKTTTKGAVK